jgi:hypothetical protein
MSLKSIFLGFIAGVIAALTAHELVNLALLHADVGFTRQPWSTTELVPLRFGASSYEVPRLVTDALWGGLWGAIFAVILGPVPKGSMTLKGILLGLLIPGLLGTMLLLPIIRGDEIFLAGDTTAIACWLAISAGFGAATAWLYGFLTSGCRLP